MTLFVNRLKLEITTGWCALSLTFFGHGLGKLARKVVCNLDQSETLRSSDSVT